MCTKIGCFVEASALPIMRSSRARVRTDRHRLRSRTLAEALTVLLPLLVPPVMNMKMPSNVIIHERVNCQSVPVPAYYCPSPKRYLGSNLDALCEQPRHFRQRYAGRNPIPAGTYSGKTACRRPGLGH